MERSLITEEKNIGFHKKNKKLASYDFDRLIKVLPELESHVFINDYGTKTIKFSHPIAVKLLNTALLKSFYNIKDWDIPDGYLCPSVPGRAEYVHRVNDLLSKGKKGKDRFRPSRVFEIGTGASMIYPIIGIAEYEWDVVATEIDDKAITNCRKIIEKNEWLREKVSLRKQTNKGNIFRNIIQKDEYFDVVICNPPFHKSLAETEKSNKRKWKNLSGESNMLLQNFGGKANELWCKGGESRFIGSIITESSFISSQCRWFTSLVSNQRNIPNLIKRINSVKGKEIKLINMEFGNKKSRILAWSF